ncbi:CHAT domain-containing protein [Limnothrix sp. FACHB-708]|uniref:CHAT domain-containing protein n=1 Tax=unclassified Limnothrix TaxID=2632864 RepID=UPI0016825E19|nr:MULTISPECIES: CHAT domain-containing protein [unclassified Limnothrix]MBD2552111.1 CHAT domain-containing protein [Limnothrix sp. FACHB-708]MBD2589791.1 CHAT domain-containing protein [Limnothrix sp. FACHB-406]
MDEQRLQAYLQLIQQLLACPEGEEASVLQAQAELVDAGLVEIMYFVPGHMASIGHRDAVWLKQWANRIAQTLELRSKTVYANPTTMSFIGEVMINIYENQGSANRVYEFWKLNLRKLNWDFLIALPLAFQVLKKQNSPELVAAMFGEFGNLIGQFHLGIRWLNLEMAIVSCNLSLEIYTRESFPEDWATAQHNLANAYLDRIWGSEVENKEIAISIYKKSLEIRSRDFCPQDWAMTQNSLANAYRNRIQGKITDNLEMAIDIYKKVLEVYTYESFPQDWAMTQNNLAIAYYDRVQGYRSDNLEMAIDIYKDILKVYTRESFPQKWAMIQNNLGAAYRHRIFGERADNFEMAIAAYQLALQVRKKKELPEQWAATHSNLAVAYSNRIRGKKTENLEMAINHCKLALEVYTRDTFPRQWATIQNNLATMYGNRLKGEKADNLEKAIALCKAALKIRRFDNLPVQWAATQHNLATAYSQRVKGTKGKNQEAAIIAYKLAIKVYKYDAFPYQWAAIQNNLAHTYRDYLQEDEAENLKQAITAYNLALKVRTHQAFPNECRQTARSLGKLQSELQNWDAATQAYGQALAAAENLYQACTLLDSQAGELKETGDLPRRAAYAYAKIGQLDQAVATIERGRARGLSERLQRDRADLVQLQQQRPDLFDRYRDITNQLQNLESLQREQQVRDRQAITPEQHRNEAQRLRQELTEAIAQIRQVPGYETFLQAPSLAEIQQNLSTEAPTVYLIPTPNGSLALIATPQAIDPLWLDAFPEATLTDLVQTWLNASQNHRNDFPGWLEAIDQGTRQLWDNLMAPLIDRLKQHNYTQAILIPTGLLGLLPLHAAWTPDPSRPTGRRYALDELTFTYAPNAQSLVAARAIAQRFPDSHLDSILAIDNPRQDLPSSEREVMAAVKTFPRPTVLRHEKATTATVAANLGQQAIVHFSCHGTANFNEPLNSGLLMNDDLLTLRDLFNLKLTEGGKHGIRLAVLSACETGLPGLDLADEAIGLPVGLLQAGVAGAIASLWAVNEQSTMILLTKFYDLWRNDHLTPPIALRQAQQWLRTATPSEIRQLTGIGLRGAEHPFAHPYYWAGFSYTGI